METKYLVGIDVGSTTVKAVAVDGATDRIAWSDYQRHETKQPEKALEFLQRLEADLGIGRSGWPRSRRPNPIVNVSAGCGVSVGSTH